MCFFKNHLLEWTLPTVVEYTSPFDATVVKLLQEAGATIFGKTNCDEFGMGYVFSIHFFLRISEIHPRSLNTHSIHGQVVNPIDTSEQRSAGGSSGGSAAAVAAGMCDALVLFFYHHIKFHVKI